MPVITSAEWRVVLCPRSGPTTGAARGAACGGGEYEEDTEVGERERETRDEALGLCRHATQSLALRAVRYLNARSANGRADASRG